MALTSWGKDATVKFVEAYREQESLWNTTLKTLTPPYYANSNEAEERAVQNIKAAIKRSLQDQPSSFQNLQHVIDNYLMVYRNTPHTVTERTPAEMFLGCRPTTRLSILQPNLTKHVEKKKAATTPALVRVKSYHEGEKVWVRSVREEEVKWFLGVVTKIKSLSTCLVRVNGFTRFVYVDYLKPRSTSELPQMGTNSNPAVNINPPSSQGSVVQPEDKRTSDVQREPPPQCDMKTTMSDVQPPPLPLTNSEPTQEPLRRPTRIFRSQAEFSLISEKCTLVFVIENLYLLAIKRQKKRECKVQLERSPEPGCADPDPTDGPSFEAIAHSVLFS
ncbi:hypothetical protein ILUMI_04674 [Ignelater luminosus]|uniref:Integrase catalytic domain-containing protein n=1 Tax=Ignelater luminosus TaxID=2038154 RepID=A0A8K0GH44_IGNLU|nr:hypothetical protein ILUMI_04674 [Ignelater luminosus]